MNNKYCRICWNTSGWRSPTGDAAEYESKGSYLNEYRFGHEEWLFNYQWLIDGFRYAHLQPIRKFYDKYKGQLTYPPETRPL